MSEFARQVVREEVALTSLVPTFIAQKRREKLVGAILGSDVYCHFRHVGNRLRCAFSNERKCLLGETVLDWLEAEHGASNFLWCETLDGVSALVLVVDGRVVKEVTEARDWRREKAAALARLGPDATVYQHSSVSDRNLARDPRTRPLDRSVIYRIRTGDAVELGSVGDIPAVRVWNAFWKWTRLVAFAGVAVAAVVFAYDYFRGDEPTPQQAAQQTRQRSLTEYDRLLVVPGARSVLTAMHGAYREFLADPFFDGKWRVVHMTWKRAQGEHLEIRAELPHSPNKNADIEPQHRDDIPFGVPWEQFEDLKQAVKNHARSRRWPFGEVSKLHVTLYLPLAVAPRTRDQGEAYRLPEPADELDRWRFRGMRRHFEPFGRLRLVTGEDASGTKRVRQRPITRASYDQKNYELRFAGLEWAYDDAARWLGESLSGGPVVLDAVELERAATAQAAAASTWQAELRFRTIWCRKGHSCERPEAPAAG